MADAPRTDTPAAPSSGARTRRILIVLGILVVAISAVGFFAGGRLSCAVGIALADCPAAGADLAAPVGPEEPAVPGQFELRLSSGVELDTDPPSMVTAGAGDLATGDLFYDNRRNTGGSLYTADHPLAAWTGAGAPDSAGCLDAIVSEGVFSADPEPGQILCAQTTEGRIAALTVTQVLDEGVLFVSTVWS